MENVIQNAAAATKAVSKKKDPISIKDYIQVMGPAIKAALPSVTYSGVSGAISFDSIGDAVRDTAFIKTADTANGVWALETVQTGSSN